MRRSRRASRDSGCWRRSARRPGSGSTISEEVGLRRRRRRGLAVWSSLERRQSRETTLAARQSARRSVTGREYGRIRGPAPTWLPTVATHRRPFDSPAALAGFWNLRRALGRRGGVGRSGLWRRTMQCSRARVLMARISTPAEQTLLQSCSRSFGSADEAIALAREVEIRVGVASARSVLPLLSFIARGTRTSGGAEQRSLEAVEREAAPGRFRHHACPLGKSGSSARGISAGGHDTL